MEHLPPLGWADVATKRDLDQLAAVTKHDLDQLKAQIDARFDANGQVLEARFEATEHRLMAAFYAEMNRQTRIMVVSMATAFAAVAGVAFGLAQLA